MNLPAAPDDIHALFAIVGAALMRTNANNTHSGNMSMRDPLDRDVFYVTASGSQCGELAPRDIVPLRFSRPGWQGIKPSTEAGIHRRILELPEVEACAHSHSIASIALSLESAEKPTVTTRSGLPGPEGDELLFQPVDFFGAGMLGPVRIGAYREPVGSVEMEQRIPRYLGQDPVTIVRGHGPFARGRSLAQCLHLLSVLENSARLATTIARRGVAAGDLSRRIIADGFERTFPATPRPWGDGGRAEAAAGEKPFKAEFGYWLAYNFNFGLGALGAGSMSRKLSDATMAFCPMAAAPAGFDVPILRLPLDGGPDDPHDVQIHRLIYRRTAFAACMLTPSPLATAEAMAVWAQHGGGADAVPGRAAADPARADGPLLRPIDAEGRYLYGRIPVAGLAALAPDAPENPIPELLSRHAGCCLVAGYGVIAAGGQSLEQAAHHVSSAERIARFRQEVDLNHKLLGGPPLEAFE